MSISIFIIGIILGGLAVLVTLIFTILTLVAGKTQKAIGWIIGFVISLSIMIVSIVHVLRSIGAKVKNGIEWAADYNSNPGSNYNSDTNEADQKSARQAFLDTLQLYTNENLKGKVPVDFYINRSAEKMANGKIKLPFVYPFSVHYNIDSYLGDIANNSNDSIYLNNVSQMAFDQNFVIARLDNTNDTMALKAGRGEIEYILFDLRTRQYLEFSSMHQLLDKSAKIGYSGSTQLNYLSDDYRGWIDAPEYD